jgi:hypothetical protein
MELFDVVSAAATASTIPQKGVSLESIIPSSGLSVDKVRSYSAQLAHALAVMHAAPIGAIEGEMLSPETAHHSHGPVVGVAHLDISLTNVCVHEEEENLAIIDFGVADVGTENQQNQQQIQQQQQLLKESSITSAIPMVPSTPINSISNNTSNLLSPSNTLLGSPTLFAHHPQQHASDVFNKRGSNGSGLALALAQTRLLSPTAHPAVNTGITTGPIIHHSHSNSGNINSLVRSPSTGSAQPSHTSMTTSPMTPASSTSSSRFDMSSLRMQMSPSNSSINNTPSYNRLGGIAASLQLGAPTALSLGSPALGVSGLSTSLGSCASRRNSAAGLPITISEHGSGQMETSMIGTEQLPTSFKAGSSGPGIIGGNVSSGGNSYGLSFLQLAAQSNPSSSFLLSPSSASPPASATPNLLAGFISPTSPASASSVSSGLSGFGSPMPITTPFASNTFNNGINTQQQQMQTSSTSSASTTATTSATSLQYFFTSPVSRRGSVASLLQSSAVEEEDEPSILRGMDASSRSSSDNSSPRTPVEREQSGTHSKNNSTSGNPFSPLPQPSVYTTPVRRPRKGVYHCRRISVELPPTVPTGKGNGIIMLSPPTQYRELGISHTTTTQQSHPHHHHGQSQTSFTLTGPNSLVHTPATDSSMTWPVAGGGAAARMRFDMPPSKQHCQSPEQRACTVYHTSPTFGFNNPVPTNNGITTDTDTNMSVSNPKGWCPFASDVYAFGVIVYEMSTGNRWNASLMEPLAAEQLHQEQKQLENKKVVDTNAMETDEEISVIPIGSPSHAPNCDNSVPVSVCKPPSGMDPSAWDLVRQCIAPEGKRITAAAALQHPFIMGITQQ